MVGFSAALLVALVAMASGVGCGAETSEPDPLPSGERYLPLDVGATWTWRVTPGADPAFEKTSTVEALEDVGDSKAGTMAYRVRTLGKDGETVSWQEDTGQAVRRHREQSFSATQVMTSDQMYTPAKLRIDESAARLVVGTTYVETYTEEERDPATGAIKTVSKSESWTVEAIDESVTVPAGTFPCLRLRRVGTDVSAAEKRFWFARGVGKVKEVGGQTEELASYDIP